MLILTIRNVGKNIASGLGWGLRLKFGSTGKVWLGWVLKTSVPEGFRSQCRTVQDSHIVNESMFGLVKHKDWKQGEMRQGRNLFVFFYASYL